MNFAQLDESDQKIAITIFQSDVGMEAKAERILEDFDFYEDQPEGIINAVLAFCSVPRTESTEKIFSPFATSHGLVMDSNSRGFLQLAEFLAPTGVHQLERNRRDRKAERLRIERSLGDAQDRKQLHEVRTTSTEYVDALERVLSIMTGRANMTGDLGDATSNTHRVYWQERIWLHDAASGLYAEQPDSLMELHFTLLMGEMYQIMPTGSQTKQALWQIKREASHGIYNPTPLYNLNEKRVDGIDFKAYLEGNEPRMSGVAAGLDHYLTFDAEDDYNIKLDRRHPLQFFISGLITVPDLEQTTRPEFFDYLLTNSFPDFETDRQRFVEMLAYLIYKEGFPAIVQTWHGIGGSGKSTWMDSAMRVLFAGYSGTRSTSLVDLGGRFETSKLHGARVMVIPDLERYQSFSAQAKRGWAILRQISGGDEVRDEAKNKQSADTRYTATPVIITNQIDLPLIDSSDSYEATMRRIVPIQFKHRVSQERGRTPKQIKDGIREEAAGILGYLAHVHRDMLKSTNLSISSETFTMSPSASEVLAAIEASKPLERTVRGSVSNSEALGHFDFGKDKWILARDLHTYIKRTLHMSRTQEKHFRVLLEEVYGVYKSKVVIEENATPSNIFRGLRLMNPPEKEE